MSGATLAEHLGLPPGSVGGLAYDALMAAQGAQSTADKVAEAQAGHEKLCAERYKNIDDRLRTLFKIITWAGTSAFVLLMGILGFLAKTQFDTITALQRATTHEQVRPQVIIQSAPGQPSIGAAVERQQQ